jgi:hypothetical protein
MSGPEFFQTKMGRIFFEGTMPELVRQLKQLNANMEELYADNPIPYVATQAGQRFRSDRPNIANGPKSLWDNNLIQFARLLCEIRAACEMEGFDQVLESMDLNDEQMDELWERAEQVWEQSKAEHCPPPKAKPDSGGVVGGCRIPMCPHCDVALVRDGNDAPGFHHCPKCNSSFMSVRVRCDDCGWKGLEGELVVRLDPGGEVPVGECPSCGALAYHERSDNKTIPHLAHVDQLEVAVYGDKDSVTVECTRCGEVVHELFNREFEG